MKLNNACCSALENTVSSNSSYYLMRHLVELQIKTNGWNIVQILGFSLFPAVLLPLQMLNSDLPLHAHTHHLREIHVEWCPGPWEAVFT